MIINNEHNRTNVECSVSEALELIAELSKSVDAALRFGHRTTNGMAATERVTSETGFKPSSFNVTINNSK